MFTLPYLRQRSAKHRRARTRRLGALACAGALLATGATSADLLPDFPEQRIAPGDVLELDIEVRSPTASVHIERAPVDATLEPRGPGRWTLRWPTSRRHEGRNVIRLGAVDRAGRSVRESREIVVVRDAEPSRAAPPTAPPAASPAASPAAAPAALPAAAPAPDPTSTEAVAPLHLPAIAPLRLLPGRAWELRIAALEGGRGPRGTVAMHLVGAPDGLDVVPVDDGWHALRWRPSAAQTGTHVVELLAVDARDPTRRTRRALTLTVSSEPSGPAPASMRQPELVEVPAVNRSDADVSRASGPEAASASLAEPAPEPPRLRPLSNQIVSAGKAVAFKVRTADPDGRERAVVRIDRLPRNASFDENPDGSRTFHWPTSDRDQGEHRFRITATNPVDASLADSADVLVVVGDPSRGRTVPAGDIVRP